MAASFFWTVIILFPLYRVVSRKLSHAASQSIQVLLRRYPCLCVFFGLTEQDCIYRVLTRRAADAIYLRQSSPEMLWPV